MAGLVKQMNLKRMPVNRILIAAMFVVTGLLSLIFWVKGKKGDSEGWSLGEWWGPLKITYEVERSRLTAPRDTSRETGQLITKVRKKLEEASGSHAFYVLRLKEGKGYGWKEEEMMPAASIMKVPIMATVFEKIEQGKMTLGDVYELKETDKQQGSGPVEFMEVGIKLSVGDLLRVTGKNSDNSATKILVSLAGRDEIKKKMKELGMETSDFDKNTTSAYDLAMMWKSLNEKPTPEMWDLLRDSIYEDRIPAGLPKEADVIHKVGTGDGVWADAGIIQCAVLSAQCSVEPFVLVILNKEVDTEKAKVVIPEAVKIIWDFEKSRSVKQ